MQGRKALKIVWDDGPNADYDSAAYKAKLEESAHKQGRSYATTETSAQPWRAQRAASRR